MKTISVAVSGNFFKMNNIFIELPYFKYIKDHNINKLKINTSDLSSISNFLIIYNSYYLPALQIIRQIILNPKINIIYLATDSEVVLPFNNDKNLMKLTRYIDIIVTYKDKFLKNPKFKIFKFYPYYLYKDSYIKMIEFNYKKRLVMIQSNKFSVSKLQTYSYRKKIIKHYENSSEKFDLFGLGWPTNKNYKGEIIGSYKEKFIILKNYKFAFAIENNSSEKGYITEKAFDCLHCGVIPIYLGATNIKDYLPDYCYIDLRNFKSLDHLDNYLNKMTQEEYKLRITKIQFFLTQSQIYTRDNDCLNELILPVINKNYGCSEKKSFGFIAFILIQNFKSFLRYIPLKLIVIINTLSLKLKRF